MMLETVVPHSKPETFGADIKNADTLGVRNYLIAINFVNDRRSSEESNGDASVVYFHGRRADGTAIEIKVTQGDKYTPPSQQEEDLYPEVRYHPATRPTPLSLTETFGADVHNADNLDIRGFMNANNFVDDRRSREESEGVIVFNGKRADNTTIQITVTKGANYKSPAELNPPQADETSSI